MSCGGWQACQLWGAIWNASKGALGAAVGSLFELASASKAGLLVIWRFIASYEDSLPLDLAVALAFHQAWYLPRINVKRLTALVPDVCRTSAISDRRLLVVFRGIPIELKLRS